MVKPGRIPERERSKAVSGINQALKNNPKGLGVRELRKASGIKSYETLYKYLPELLAKKIVAFSEVSVGRGKPKKIYTLSKKGIAASVEFKIMEHFEKIREACKENEQFEIDNYAFSYAIYGMPKNLTRQENEQAKIILDKINSALLDLDNFRYDVINKEVYSLRNKIAKAHAKIIQYVLVKIERRNP